MAVGLEVEFDTARQQASLRTTSDPTWLTCALRSRSRNIVSVRAARR